MHWLLIVSLILLFLSLLTNSIGTSWNNHRRFASISRLESKIDLLLEHAGLKYEPLAMLPPGVADAIGRREKIEAIKLHRAATGAGLKESKEFIEEAMGEGSSGGQRLDAFYRIEPKIDVLLSHEGLKYEPLAMLPPGVADAIRRREKIEAIKLHRAATGAGLKESKEFIEEAFRRANLPE
jgi:hypothetical protein